MNLRTTNSKTTHTRLLPSAFWRLLLHKESLPLSSRFSLSSDFSVQWDRMKEHLSFVHLLWRFIQEIYYISPTLVLSIFVLRSLAGMETSLMLYASTRLLKSVEVGLIQGRADVQAILRAVCIRLACVALTSTISYARDQVTPMLETRVKLHFEEYSLRAKLRLDIPTAADKNSRPIVSSDLAWDSFTFLTRIFERVSQVSSQILIVLRQTNGGIIFTALSLVGPIINTTHGQNIWRKAYIIFSENPAYLRLRALHQLAFGDTYREGVVSSNLGGWIVEEYRKARQALGDVSDGSVHSAYRARKHPIIRIISRLSYDLPMLYWAAHSILFPNTFSVSAFAILQQHAQVLTYTFQLIHLDWTRATQCLTHIRELYEMGSVENKLRDGDEAYPSSKSSENGMSFELKNVSFNYPEAKSKSNAIKNVSLKIPAGHLVVIVGANGSGKSTIIKLLNRLYDADSGEILVDGIPIKNYRISDLRRVQALLTQDHVLYPLSLAENIGLGNPERVHDMDMVAQAAESGGADGVIERQKDGFDAILDPVSTARAGHLDKKKHKKLKEILEGLEKKAEVSGGERQRLVASRTFMRLFSGNIRFATADEPSSALDPKGEYQLFQRLRESRQGKTMIFVTHRFGHLTKHADLIMQVEFGEAIETGTHKELMARGGEYFELYNIQAQAFVDASIQ
ncbi:lipid A export ATP-binding/permease protein MsbA [Favolaschia claudopus]|uniref:Lipid A export ATP-binding/permease protein MsbA n=1 Tax=Favolaschia claudopus TaxID=2862362 RepID=A0AAV9ZZG6_9AGAR